MQSNKTLTVTNNVTQKEVRPQDDESPSLSDELEEIRDKLYARYGHGAINEAAEDLGVRRERVSNLLSESAREIVADLEKLIQSDRQ